jgi:3-oxoadipate enol-lactonase/4-carboxymuconolactone decarboxylase
MAVRRAIFGDEAVDRALADQSNFNQQFQDFNTRHVFAAVWARPGLDLRTRCCIAVALFAAAGRPPEQQSLYIRAALRNGVTPDELFEVILQAEPYCGVARTSVALRAAQEILKELETNA